MNMFIFFISTSLLLLIAGNTSEASFDCKKAVSKIEKMICGNDELSKLDESLNQVYLEALKRIDNKNAMIISQKQWLKQERNVCADTECIKKSYNNRINELGLSSYGIVIFRDPNQKIPQSTPAPVPATAPEAAPEPSPAAPSVSKPENQQYEIIEIEKILRQQSISAKNNNHSKSQTRPSEFFASSPESYYGTYQAQIRDCEVSFIVLNKQTINMDECKSIPYKIIEIDARHIVIEILPLNSCNYRIINLERKMVQYNAKRKGSRTEIPKFIKYTVETYQDSDDIKGHKALIVRNYLQVDPSKAADQRMRFLKNKSAKLRKDALHEMNLQCYEDRDKYNEIGLKDPSAEVRHIAAYFLRGEPNHFVPLLIYVMANDPDSSVRASAGYSLTHFYTDNGSDGDLYIKPLEDNLDKLLIGLKKVETVRSIVEILGSRYTGGGSFAPCFMSEKNRRKIINALRNQLKAIRHQADESMKGRASWSNELNEADNEIDRAIDNLTKCHPTN